MLYFTALRPVTLVGLTAWTSMVVFRAVMANGYFTCIAVNMMRGKRIMMKNMKE